MLSSDVTSPLAQGSPVESAAGPAGSIGPPPQNHDAEPPEMATGNSADNNTKFFLAAIVESSQDSIITVDFKGIITTWNHAAEAIYGYPATETIGRSLMMLTLPQDLQTIPRNIKKIQHGEIVTIFDTIRLKKDGQQIELEVMMSPVKNGAGQVVGVSAIARDITERKFTENNLRQSEARFRALISQATTGITEVDRSGKFLLANEAYCRMVGYSWEELREIRMQDITAPEIVDYNTELFNNIWQSGTPFILEKQYVRKDGSRIWVSDSVAPVPDIDGEITSAVCVTIDISERRRTDAALREKEEHQRLVLESITDYAIVTTDFSGRITGWNPGAVTMFGYSEAEALGQNITIIFTPEDREAGVPEAEMRQATETGRAEDERWHIRKDGVRFWMSGVTSLLREGDALNGFVKVARNLTDVRKAEAALRASEARLRTLSDAVPQVVWTNEASGDATYFNSRWFEYTGLSLAQSVGPGWQSIVHPDDAQTCIALWHQALATGDVFDAEYRLRGADGEYRWFIGRSVPLRDSENRVIGWFGTATDIEDLKHAEAELQRTHDELESRVEERTRELTEALEHLWNEVTQRRLVEVDRAALLKRIVTTQEEERGRISRELHDNLGQHLTAVMLGLKALETEISEPSGGRRKQESAQLDKLRGLVDGLMKAAHRQSKELRPAELDAMGVKAALGQYIRDWNELTQVPVDFQVIGWKDERLDATIETTLYRVVQEALTNVARHANATQVDVVLELNENNASVIIEDDGTGFEPGNSQGRLGILGMKERLSIVNGSLEIESSSGQGTTIFARVPLPGVVSVKFDA